MGTKELNKFTEINIMYWLLICINQLLIGFFTWILIVIITTDINWISIIAILPICVCNTIICTIFDPYTHINRDIGFIIWNEESVDYFY